MSGFFFTVFAKDGPGGEKTEEPTAKNFLMPEMKDR